MTQSIRVPNDGELATCTSHLAFIEALPGPLDEAYPAASEPLTRERVVDAIIEAIRAIRTSCAGRELNGDTNLAVDLGFESATRVELLLEVQRLLDVGLDVGVAVMFAEITIAQLADLIVTLEDSCTDWYR
ncbi:MAG: acyl carrier protein [Mycobacterium sp.]